MKNFEDYMALLTLYSDYGVVCDSANWDQWPSFFTEDGRYRLQPRENYERGMPLCLLALESRAMIEDRVYGVRETMYHDPYYQRHIVGTPRVMDEAVIDGITHIYAEANYVVIRTKYDGESTVYNCGIYRDDIVKTVDGLKFALRHAIYDTEMVPNSVIYPI